MTEHKLGHFYANQSALHHLHAFSTKSFLSLLILGQNNQKMKWININLVILSKIYIFIFINKKSTYNKIRLTSNVKTLKHNRCQTADVWKPEIKK